MSILESLSRQLEREAPLLAEDLCRVSFETPSDDAPPIDRTCTFVVDQSRTGSPTLAFCKRYLHSSMDPLKEADRLAQTPPVNGSAPDIVFCFGLGLGYHIDAIRRLSPEATVVAVTVDRTELELTASVHDRGWWQRSGPHRIVHYSDHSSFRKLISEYHASNPQILALTGFRTVFADQWLYVREVIRRWREREEVNRNTLRRFGKRWVRNTIYNLARHGVVPGIDGLAGTAEGLPIVVFGAGPTLDDVAPVLADITQSIIVVAVDTALPALARHGISADIAIIADPQYWNSRHIDRIAPENTVLIAEPATYPRNLRLWRGQRLVSASLFPLGEFIDQKLGRVLRLGAGGSVATSAWDLARILGGKPIGLAGIDLAFPGLRTHCLGSFFERRLVATADRLHPAEHGMARYLHSGIATPVDRAGGGTVLSDQRMSVYRSWFAEQFRRFPDTNTVLLSPDGSAIPGIPWTSAKDYRTTITPGPDRTKTKHRFVATIREHARGDLNTTTTAASIIDELRDSFLRLEKRAVHGLEFCRRNRGSSDPILLQHLDALDRELLDARHGEMAGFIAAEAVVEAAENRAESVDDSLSQASKIYMAIIEACGYHRDIIDRTFP